MAFKPTSKHVDHKSLFQFVAGFFDWHLRGQKKVDRFLRLVQILQILTGEKIADECVKSHIMDMEELGNQDDDALFPDIGCKQQTDSALLQKENDTSSLSSGDSSQRSAEKSRHFMLKDYFKEREE